VEAGEDVAITRHGRVVAVLVRPDRLRARRPTEAWDQADQLAARLEAARGQALAPAFLSRERAGELLDAVRADRDRR
jgi:antitoxin (DNA-binding transcriptional repressor) of toxin-antitoxin stability system